jgi:hypothetical protein
MTPVTASLHLPPIAPPRFWRCLAAAPVSLQNHLLHRRSRQNRAAGRSRGDKLATAIVGPPSTPPANAPPTQAASASRENSEYSICSATTGCTALPRFSDSAELSESEMKRFLPFLDELGHSPDAVLDRHFRIDARHAKDVERLDSKIFQALLAGLTQITRIASRRARRLGRRRVGCRSSSG